MVMTPNATPPGPGTPAAAPDDGQSPVRIIRGVAAVLAADHPVTWQRLLTDHVSDESGHCSACYSTTNGAPTWPCTLRTVAELARRLSLVGHHPAGSTAGPVGPG
jgi:hypothetical protein